jgi:proteasome beta subunit
MKLDSDSYKKLLKGTTTVGLVCSDGVVLGADSRATMDTFIASSEARKVFKIDNNFGLTIAGGVGDAQELVRILKYHNELYKMSEGRPLGPKAAMSLLSIILQENKMVPFYVMLVVGGLEGEQPMLYSIDPFGGYVDESRFTSSGSGSLTALGYIEESYRKGMNTKDGVKLIARALSIAMKRDSATGDHMTIAVINKSGYTEYTEKDVEKIASGK